MVVALLREIPKYTQYELSNLFKETLNEMNLETNELSDRLDIDERVLIDIIKGEVAFKKKHYVAVQEFLNITEEELFAEADKPTEMHFRASKHSDEIKEIVTKVDVLFNEWVFQKKIYGK